MDKVFTWAFGELLAPETRRFRILYNINIAVGLVSWLIGAIAITIPLFWEDSVSPGNRKTLRLVSISAGIAVLITLFVVPIYWRVKYGSRFGRPASDDPPGDA